MMHLSIKVTGKVQGVFYRQSTKEKADELGLTGWVRNQPDGSVEIEVAGPSDKVEQLVTWCRKGPERAVVQEVKIEELSENTIKYKSFEVVR